MARINIKTEGGIKQFNIVKPSNRVQLTEKMFSSKGRCLILTKTGSLVSPYGFPTGSHYYHGFSWGFVLPLAWALYKLKVITRKDYELTKEEVEAIQQNEKLHTAAHSIVNNASTLGIKLTKAQKKKILSI